MALCSRCTYPSIHFFVSRSRSVVWCVHVACVVCGLCVHVVLCVVLVVCVCCCVVVVVVCVLLCCGGACVWCVVKLGTLSLSLSLALSPSSSLSLSLSLSFSLLSFCFSSFSFSSYLAPSLTLALALVLSLFLLYSLLATKHYGKNRSYNTAANIEALECDLAQGKCTAVGSLPPPLPSLLPSPPLPSLKKKRGNFLLQECFWRGIYF